MQVTLILSPSEAAACAAALDFVRRNMSFDTASLQWKFRNGGHFLANVEDVNAYEYVSAAIGDAVAEESNRVHFAGYCKIF